MYRYLLLLLLFSNSVFAQVNMTLGLRAYYPFTGNANDVSGNNNNPAFNNATLTTDRNGNASSAYLFNGTSNYMRIPNSPTLNSGNQLSICAWVKVNGFYQGSCHGNSIVMKGDQDFLPGNYALRFDDAGYTNNQNCPIPVPDIAHENFYGAYAPIPVGGYNPFVQTGQWYSVVYTSDGTTGRVYVNCELKASGSIGGNNFTNSADLFLGKLNNSSFPYWFNGVMDEVRIYNRQLNMDEIKFYGGCLLNATNIEAIINTYTPVISFGICKNEINVQDASTFNTGDTVLLIQMKGAIVDSTNTATFGTITDLKSAGNYEFNYVKSKSGNTIELKNKITRTYDVPGGKVQLIRVPYYKSALVTNTLTCLPWDGSKGGVLVLNVQDTISLGGNIDVTGKGFRGGADPVTNPPQFNCYENQFYYPVNPDLASEKGEGIAIISAAKSYGKGALANGGGGGNSHNSGGGGGSNAGTGGFGGYNFEGAPCNTTVPFDNRGFGGKVLTYNNTLNKIFMGGGGGGGHSNNPEAFQAKGGNGSGIVIIMADKLQSNGFKIIANGNDGASCGSTSSTCHEGMGGGGSGGTTLLKINTYLDNTKPEVIGGKGANMTASGFGRVGPGGGGSGGVLWITSASLPGTITPTLTSGVSGVATGYANNPWGATAGQNGSTLFNLQIPIDNTLFTPNIDSVRIKDTIIACPTFDFKGFGFTNTWAIATWEWYFGDGGTANTQNTSHTYGAPGPYTVKLVVTDINGCKDSIEKAVIVDPLPVITAFNNAQICASTPVQLDATGGITYVWAPATGLSNPNIHNPVATVTVSTQYVVTGTSANGCSAKDTIDITIIPGPTVTKSADPTICPGSSTQLSMSGGTGYSWTPPATLDNSSSPTPIATPASTTMYYVTITGSAPSFCPALDSIKVTVRPAAIFGINAPADVCPTKSIQLNASGGDLYDWQPAGSLNNNTIHNPLATPTTTTPYSVLITDTVCHISATLFTAITVLPLPDIKASKSNDLDCSNDQSQLDATGGLTYEWTPISTLNNPYIHNPIAKPLIATKYIVKGIDGLGCENYDSVMVEITNASTGFYLMPSAFTPNGDGLNDCFGVKYWGLIHDLDFNIYNRWGERVFHTSNPSECWDGTYKGKKQDPNVFVYWIRARTECQPSVFRKGTFMLIR